MLIAGIGPATTVLEAAATAVGAGVVLGSAIGGIRGLLARGTIGDAESRAISGGYFGALVGALLALVDAALRYGISK